MAKRRRLDDDKTESKREVKTSGQIALKDFRIYCPPSYDRVIKKGDDVSDVPEKFKTNLKTEGVL